MQRAGDQKAKALESVLTPTQLDKYHQQRAIRAKLVKDTASKLEGSGGSNYAEEQSALVRLLICVLRARPY